MTDYLEQFRSKFRRLMELRVERDETKKAAETAETDYRGYEAELWDELSSSPLEGSIKLDIGLPYGIVAFTPTETFYARVIDEDVALEGFEQRAVVEEYTEPKIAKGRLNELVRECIEQNQKLPPGVDWYARRPIKITRQKGA